MIAPRHWTAVRSETIVSVAINALIPTAIIWTVGLAPPAAFGGADGLWSAMAKASGIATLLMTAAVTMLVRGRVAKGKVPALAFVDLPAALRLLPGSVLLRAVLLGVLAVVLLLPVGTAAAAILGILPLDSTSFALFNLLFGTLVGLIMTPIVVLRALADRAPR